MSLFLIHFCHSKFICEELAGKKEEGFCFFVEWFPIGILSQQYKVANVLGTTLNPHYNHVFLGVGKSITIGGLSGW